MNIEFSFKVYIPSSRSRKSFLFKMKCQVTSDTTRKVMISREVKVASYKETCGEEKIRVNIGYNLSYLRVTDGKLVQYPAGRIRSWIATQLVHNWEILFPFFSNYNIDPIWLHCFWTWGHYDWEKEGWTGCVGKV